MNIGDITNIVVSLTSIIAIFLAVFTFWQQNNQARLFLGVQILREWEDTFFSSDEMRRRRHKACKFIHNGDSGEIPQEAWEVLDAFDCIGIYVNKGIITPEIAWDTFYYWLNAYWYLLSKHVEQFRKYTDGTQYLKNLEMMYKAMTEFGIKKRNLSVLEKRCSPIKMKDFIDDELKSTEDPRWSC